MVGLFALLLLMSPACAKDYGVHGHTFAVEEPDLLQQIEERLLTLETTGDLAKHQEAIQEKAKQSIQRPKPVSGLTKALKTRSFYYDPTLHVPYDLKDHKGQVFHKAGTKVNPLEFRSLSRSLVFIDGDDEDQIAWALKNFDLETCKLILTSGAPFEWMERLNHPVYFDQGGKLTDKFSIKALPAFVEQDGMKLKVTEVAL